MLSNQIIYITKSQMQKKLNNTLYYKRCLRYYRNY